MLVVTGYTGIYNTHIFMSPSNGSKFLSKFEGKCYFLSNNLQLKKQAERAGWNFVFLDNLQQVDNFRISSLQSKYIKFLQFDKQIIGANENDDILYFDHKLHITNQHIEKIKNICNSDILLRHTPSIKNIDDEIYSSIIHKSALRYTEFMPQTLSWLDQKYKENYTNNYRIANTGIIYYKNPTLVKNLCDQVYQTCINLGQPQCQIIWGILSQKYEKNIQYIDWNMLKIHRRDSYSF